MIRDKEERLDWAVIHIEGNLSKPKQPEYRADVHGNQLVLEADWLPYCSRFCLLMFWYTPPIVQIN